MSSYLDSLIFGIRDVFDKLGAKLPTRTALQFKGAVTVEDDPENRRTIVTVTGGGGGGPIPVGGDLDGDSDDARVVGIQGVPVDSTPPADGDVLTFVEADGKAKWAAPAVPDASAIPFDKTGTGLSATDVQGALVELDTRPPSSDATKIQGVPVSPDALLEGQTYVKSAGGVLVPRFVSPSSDRLVDAPGTVFAALGENIYVDVASGDVDVKLPASPVIGATVRVKRLSANANLVVVDGNGATIDGDSAVSIKPGEAALFRCYAAGKWARLGKCEGVGQGVVAHLGLDYDPIALWKLDGTLADYSGNGYHLSGLSRYGANYITPTAGFECMYVSSPPSGALQRTNTDHGALFNLPNVTVQAIVNVGGFPSITSTYSQLIRAFISGSGRAAYSLELNSDNCRFTWHNASGGVVSVAFPAIAQGEWALVAATRRIIDGRAYVKIHVNGTLVASASDLDPPFVWTSGTNNVRVGVDYYGLIGSCKITPPLSDAELYAEAQRAKRAP